MVKAVGTEASGMRVSAVSASRSLPTTSFHTLLRTLGADLARPLSIDPDPVAVPVASRKPDNTGPNVPEVCMRLPLSSAQAADLFKRQNDGSCAMADHLINFLSGDATAGRLPRCQSSQNPSIPDTSSHWRPPT